MNKLTTKICFLVSVGIMLTITACQNNSKDKADDSSNEKGTPEIEFMEKKHSFGKITQGEIVTHTFKFKNVGTGNLLITKTKASCGCTVPSYNKKPIAPGEEGEIKVQFDSKGRNGYSHKTITVSSNAKNSKVVLEIESEITT